MPLCFPSKSTAGMSADPQIRDVEKRIAAEEHTDQRNLDHVMKDLKTSEKTYQKAIKVPSVCPLLTSRAHPRSIPERRQGSAQRRQGRKQGAQGCRCLGEGRAQPQSIHLRGRERGEIPHRTRCRSLVSLTTNPLPHVFCSISSNASTRIGCRAISHNDVPRWKNGNTAKTSMMYVLPYSRATMRS